MIMALMITEQCTNCGICVEECPNHAVFEGEPVYVIDADNCTECVGFFDEPQCISICLADCLVPDPARIESREELLAKKQRLWSNAQ
jgi:ferredoxin